MSQLEGVKNLRLQAFERLAAEFETLFKAHGWQASTVRKPPKPD